MYLTQRYRNLDVPTKREGPQALGLFVFNTSCCALRCGLLLQFVSIAGISIIYLITGGSLFSYTLSGAENQISKSNCFRIMAAILSFLHVIGTMFLAYFQVLLSDDASWCRGFRSGSKLIAYATSFDVMSGVIQFVLLFHLASSFSPELLTQFSQGGPEWLLTAFARLLHAISFTLYGQGFFLVENFHDVGTSATLALGIWTLFTASGVGEIFSLGFIAPTIAPLLNCATIGLALLWSLKFEDAVNQSAPRLHESELTNELESTVNNYARLGPMALGGGA